MSFPTIEAFEVARPPFQIDFSGNGELNVSFPPNTELGSVCVQLVPGAFQLSFPNDAIVSFPPDRPIQVSLNGQPLQLQTPGNNPLTVTFPSGGVVSIPTGQGGVTMDPLPIPGLVVHVLGTRAKVKPVTMDPLP